MKWDNRGVRGDGGDSHGATAPEKLDLSTPRPLFVQDMLKLAFTLALLLSALGCTFGFGQSVRLRTAPELNFPTLTDGNSSAYWLEGRLHLFTSVAWPVELSISTGLFAKWETQEVDITNLSGKALWLEAAWADSDGVVFGWYHNEPWGLYEDSLLTIPKIGAVISFDGGRTIRDLGVVLESGDEPDDQAQNGAFTGGHGDFSVILDRDGKYFYFFFTNYGGPAESQGVSVARMAFADRFDPVGKVWKYHKGEWVQPGVGGRVTPLFAAARAWNHRDPDSFWGPAVHWNTHLSSFVMLLNRTQGDPGWSQEGMYVTFAKDLGRPETWKTPGKFLDGSALEGWGSHYPQVMGLEAGGTDTLAGKIARFFVSGASKWEIEFVAGTDVQPLDTNNQTGASRRTGHPP